MLVTFFQSRLRNAVDTIISSSSVTLPTISTIRHRWEQGIHKAKSIRTLEFVKFLILNLYLFLIFATLHYISSGSYTEALNRYNIHIMHCDTTQGIALPSKAFFKKSRMYNIRNSLINITNIIINQNNICCQFTRQQTSFSKTFSSPLFRNNAQVNAPNVT